MTDQEIAQAMIVILRIVVGAFIVLAPSLGVLSKWLPKVLDAVVKKGVEKRKTDEHEQVNNSLVGRATLVGLESVGRTVDHIEEDLKTISRRVDEAFTQLAKHTELLKMLTAQVQGINGNLNRVSVRVDAFETRVKALESTKGMSTTHPEDKPL